MRIWRIWTTVTTALGIITFANAMGSAEPTQDVDCTPTARPSAKATADIRNADWCNIPPSFGSGTIKDGSAEYHEYDELGAEHDTIITRLRSVTYGDIDGGKSPVEAFVVVEQNVYYARRNQPSNRTTIYAYRSGKPGSSEPEVWSQIPTGTPVVDITVRKGRVSVTSGPTDQRNTINYRFRKNGTAVQVGKPVNSSDVSR
jgi:hypothetical protein